MNIYSLSDEESFYEGHVFGEKTSHVSAHFDGELLTATIETHDETYHVEVRLLIE